MPSTAQVHRCRFVRVVPSAIEALAFGPAMLAVARADSNVEVWRSRGGGRSVGWHRACFVAGAEGQHVSALAFTPGGRLLATGLEGTVFEVDLGALAHTHVRDSYGGAAWALAVQGEITAAVGCEDGTVRLFSLADGGLEYYKSLAGAQARVLALAWHPSQDVLFAAGADGVIRRWGSATGALEARMTLAGFGAEPPVVWALAALSDGTLVSGDSEGRVQVWDGEQAVLRSTVQRHAAAVLCLAVSEDEQRVFASGADPQVVMLQKRPGEAEEWVYSYAHRPHTHDVRALAVSGDQLVSGGLDTQLCVIAVGAFREKRASKVPPFSPSMRVHVAAGGRRLLAQQRHALELWSLEGELEAEVRLAGGDNLACSAISPDGRWLAAGDRSALRVFLVREGSRRVRRGEGLPGVACNCVAFSPDSRALFAATLDRRLVALRLAGGVSFEAPLGAVGTALSGSADGAWVAAATLAGDVRVFSTDTGAQHFRVDPADSLPTAIAFHPGGGPSLVVAYASNRFDVFDVEERAPSDWTKAYGGQLPAALLGRPQPVMGISFDPAQPATILLHSHGFLCVLDLEKAPPAPPSQQSKRQKSAAGGGGGEVTAPGFTLLDRFRPAVGAGFVGPAELAVIETPWIQIMSSFPDALYRPAYGT